MNNENSQQVSYMSNAKWKKFFMIMKEHRINYRKASWKLLGNEAWHDSWMLDGNHAGEQDDYTTDRVGGVIKYMNIEQIKIPRKFKSRENDVYVKQQDIETFGRLLKKYGNFKIEADSESLTIFGYK